MNILTRLVSMLTGKGPVPLTGYPTSTGTVDKDSPGLYTLSATMGTDRVSGNATLIRAQTNNSDLVSVENISALLGTVSFSYAYSDSAGVWNRQHAQGTELDGIAQVVEGVTKTAAYQYNFNGVTWDRVKTQGNDQDGLLPFSNGLSRNVVYPYAFDPSFGVWNRVEWNNTNLDLDNSGIHGSLLTSAILYVLDNGVQGGTQFTRPVANGISGALLVNEYGQPHFQQTLTVTNVAQEFAESDGFRTYIAIQNNHAVGNIYVGLLGTATVADGIKIKPGETWEPRTAPFNSINIIGDIASNSSVIMITAPFVEP